MNYIKQIRSAELFSTSRIKPLETFECRLVSTESYVESFETKPIALQKNVLELVIKTQLLSAKNPSEWRIKSRTCVELDSLKELQKIIDGYLKKRYTLETYFTVSTGHIVNTLGPNGLAPVSRRKNPTMLSAQKKPPPPKVTGVLTKAA